MVVLCIRLRCRGNMLGKMLGLISKMEMTCHDLSLLGVAGAS